MPRAGRGAVREGSEQEDMRREAQKGSEVRTRACEN